MLNYESKFGIKYAFKQSSVFLPLLILSFFLIRKLVSNVNEGQPFALWGTTIFIPILCFTFIGIAIRYVYKITPKVIITDNSIYIGHRQISFGEIKFIEVRPHLKSREPRIEYNYEVSTLELQSGEIIRFAVEYYQNGNLIRVNLSRLKDFLEGKSPCFEVINRDEIVPKIKIYQYPSKSTKFFRSPFKSYLSCLYLGLCLMFFWAAIINMDIVFTSGFFFTFACFLFVILGFQSHYFIVTDKHLIVKNYFLPIKDQVFEIQNIEAMEKGQSYATRLKIITHNYRIYRFYCNLISAKMCRQLITKVYQIYNDEKRGRNK